EGGKPLAGQKVGAVLSRKRELYGKELPAELLMDFQGYPAWGRLLRVEATTDKDGKFVLEGRGPGLKDTLVRGKRAQPLGGTADESTVEAGKTTNLGDLSTTGSDK